jgi:hypothetical protein
METEGAEAGKPEFISSLGWEDGLIARTAGSAITNQRRDLRRHAGGRPPCWTFAVMFSARPMTSTPTGERESTTESDASDGRLHQ